MQKYIKEDPWRIIEDSYDATRNEISESIFSIGNGYMGQRANFEETYSGPSMQGSYLAGVYFPDKTRVGWWKNGYPEYFAKVINSVNWIGIDIIIDNKTIDLNLVQISNFSRILDMQKGVLSKSMRLTTVEGYELEISSERFCSWDIKELGTIQYKLKSINYNGKIGLRSYLDFNVRNQDTNYDEQFWTRDSEGIGSSYSYVSAVTKKTLFHVHAVMHNDFENPHNLERSQKIMHCAEEATWNISSGDTLTCHKYVAILSSLNHTTQDIAGNAVNVLEEGSKRGYKRLKALQISAWKKIWEQGDIIIEGDVSAQQGIRYNIFQLKQTYSGHDARLNIGPKGFTGEKYGGVTYWDTEAYCIPFYLSTAPKEIAYNLLKYRHNQLDKAIENAAKLGFKDGAALYPMVTINGEECHNEWEITFEEIHRNGAIAYAIYNYTRYTGDDSYLKQYGIEVLIAISRFWSQRASWSSARNKYVILGVTGPNEYENNVNNNWYTNYIACWCLRYTMDTLQELSKSDPDQYKSIVDKTDYKISELERWNDISNNMHYPYDEDRQVFLQQDGFLDKELKTMADLPAEEYPIHKHWSWDRILRSCYIKQADVLQGLYFFYEDFDKETVRRNYYFYEPMTVHESSLSPCVHAILAARLGDKEKAYEMYLRTARLDLDNYNHDTQDGLHITSMGGTWMSVAMGIGGMTIENDKLSFYPFLPESWGSCTFKIRYRQNLICMKVEKDRNIASNLSGPCVSVYVNGKEEALSAKEVSEYADINS